MISHPLSAQTCIPHDCRLRRIISDRAPVNDCIPSNPSIEEYAAQNLPACTAECTIRRRLIAQPWAYDD